MAVNYTDKDSISIDDINETPISTGYNYTFSSVFGALNKIIKAIINKFKKDENEVDILHKGRMGIVSDWDIDVKPGNTTSKIITIDNEHYWTHGYIYIRNSVSSSNLRYTLNNITQLQSVTSTGVYGENVSLTSKAKYGKADISYTITHENNGTYIKVEVTNTGSTYNFKFSNFDFKYELY